jgi:hypothetical protein
MAPKQLWAVAMIVYSLYWSLMAGTKLANLSLQTTPCREDEKNFILFYNILMFFMYLGIG